MNKVKLFGLFYIFIFCTGLFAQTNFQTQTNNQIHVADKTKVDNSGPEAQAHMYETCQTELNYAKQDPEKYVDSKLLKIRSLLADQNLYYWETYALTELFRNAAIQNPNKIFLAAREATDVLELVNENLSSQDKNKKQWGFLYTIVDFVSEKFFVADKNAYDAEQLTKILASIAVGYGEKTLDIDGSIGKQEQTANTLLDINNTSRSRGLAAIQELVERTDAELSYKALEALACIANAEKQKLGQTANIKDIESINILHWLVYYNPLAGKPNVNCVVDINRTTRNETEKQQATAMMYLGMLGDNDFLNSYSAFGQNKMALNTAAQFLGKELPHPYYGVLSTVGNVFSTLHDVGLMTSFPKAASLTEVSFSASEGWATSKLISPTANAFSDVSGLQYTINPSMGGAATATLQIPKMMEFMPYVSTQMWSIPSALKSAEAMKALFYIVRVVPSTAIIIEESGTYKMDAVNKTVRKIENLSALDKSKAYVAVSITLPDGKTIEYLIWTNTSAEASKVIEYIKASGTVNPGLIANIKTSDLTPTGLAQTPTLSNSVLPAKTENTINKILKASNLNIKEQTDILNAFKSRTSLASPRVINKFIDGNTIYSNVEVFTNPNGATVLKITRGLSTSNGIVNFTRTFTYGVDGQVKETSSIQDADAGAKATALTDAVADGLDEAITEYNNYCNSFTPKI